MWISLEIKGFRLGPEGASGHSFRPLTDSLLLIINHMPAKRRQDIGEDLEDADDEKAHDNPLADLLGQGGLDEAAEAKAQDGDDQRHHDGRPDGKAFAEGAFVDHKSVN